MELCLVVWWSNYDPTNVDITGGKMNGVVIGVDSPASANFTSFSALLDNFKMILL